MMIILLNIVFMKKIIDYKKVFLIFLLITLSFLLFASKYSLVGNNNFNIKVYDVLPHLNGTILSDPITSYHLSSIKGYDVFSAPINHPNDANTQEVYSRYMDSYAFLISQNVSLKRLMEKYGERKITVVLNKNIISDGYLFTDQIDGKKLSKFLSNYSKGVDYGQFTIYTINAN